MFTYNAAAPDSDLDRVRLYIGDTVEGEGPRVAGRNYSDGELGLLLTQAGSWTGAVGLALTALANEWAAAAINLKSGAQSVDYTAVAEQLRGRAHAWAAQWDTATNGAARLSAGSLVLDWWETLE